MFVHWCQLHGDGHGGPPLQKYSVFVAKLIAEGTFVFLIAAPIFLLLMRTLPSTDKVGLRIDIMGHILCTLRF